MPDTPLPARPCTRSAPAQRGFGLIEVLVGCVLMAVLSLGACAALHQALRAVRSAALQGHAAGLVMDLAEELALAADEATARQITGAWQQRVHGMLPGARGEVVPGGSSAGIRLSWSGTADVRDWLALPLPPPAVGDAP